MKQNKGASAAADQALVASPSNPQAVSTEGFDPSRIVNAFNDRLAIYRSKRQRADLFAEDSYNRHEALAYVIEAIELVAIEAGLGKLVPHGDEE